MAPEKQAKKEKEQERIAQEKKKKQQRLRREQGQTLQEALEGAISSGEDVEQDGEPTVEKEAAPEPKVCIVCSM